MHLARLSLGRLGLLGQIDPDDQSPLGELSSLPTDSEVGSATHAENFDDAVFDEGLDAEAVVEEQHATERERDEVEQAQHTVDKRSELDQYVLLPTEERVGSSEFDSSEDEQGMSSDF